jgi:DNA-binding transcriptional LysR family regulator
MGLALVPRCLVHDEITAGLVREPLPDAPLRGGYQSDMGYWFCYPEGRTQLHALQCFRQWLLVCAEPAAAVPATALVQGSAPGGGPGAAS